MKQTIFTIILPVVPGRQHTLRERLFTYDYQGEAPAADPLGFASVETLHYASLFLYDDATDGWSLVFESNIDGEIAPYLNAFVDGAKAKDQGQTLLNLFRNCKGFEQGEIQNLAAYLGAYVNLPSAGYSGCVGRSQRQITLESQIHARAGEVLSNLPADADATTAAKAVWQALEQDPKFKDIAAIPKDTPKAGDLLAAQSPPASEPSGLLAGLVFLGQVLRALGRVLLRAGPGPVLKALLAAVVFLLTGLWNQLRKEPAAAVDEWRPDPAHVRSQRATEDFLPTNHMVSVVHLHTDLSRRLAKWSAFVLLDLLARYEYTKGKLGAIPTIHFAHWAVLNGSRRLLFVSNFDGSWDSYLDDFTLKAASGLTLAWAHGVGFPTSVFMLGGGAAEGPAFIDWARRSMVPTPVWYKAHPHLSIRNINRNSALRQLMVEDGDRVNKGNWLELVQ